MLPSACDTVCSMVKSLAVCDPLNESRELLKFKMTPFTLISKVAEGIQTEIELCHCTTRQVKAPGKPRHGGRRHHVPVPEGYLTADGTKQGRAHVPRCSVPRPPPAHSQPTDSREVTVSG
jgi:hypothetical protein